MASKMNNREEEPSFILQPVLQEVSLWNEPRLQPEYSVSTSQALKVSDKIKFKEDKVYYEIINFMCHVTHYHKLHKQQYKTAFIISHHLWKYEHSLTGSTAYGLTGCHQGVCQTGFLYEGSTGEEYTSKLPLANSFLCGSKIHMFFFSLNSGREREEGEKLQVLYLLISHTQGHIHTLSHKSHPHSRAICPAICPTRIIEIIFLEFHKHKCPSMGEWMKKCCLYIQ